MKKTILCLIILLGFCISCQKRETSTDQTLHINLKKEPVSLDPRIGNDIVATQVHFMLYEGLVKLEPDLTLSLAQAKSYEISPDGKRYTFYLGDTKWSDGSAVTALDFEKSWKSILDPHFYCPDSYLLNCIKNGRAAKQGQLPLDSVGIFAKDSKTLIVDLEKSTPHFLQIVASSVLLPVKDNLYNGPFSLKTWKPHHSMILKKNPFFRGASAVALKQISIEIVEDGLELYRSGHFDLIGSPLSAFPAKLLKDLKNENQLTFFPVATTKFLSFNTSVFPFHNANLRRAFALSINRKEIVDQITQLDEKEALNFIPPVLCDSSPLFNDADTAKAKECLKKGLEELNIELKDLEGISFVYVSSEINLLLAQELQELWSKVLGVKVTLENVEFKTLHERSKEGAYSIGIFAWLADYADPMNILERFQDKTSHRNYCKWENSTYNELLEKGALKDAEVLLADEMPITGLFHDSYAFMIHPHVKGFAISPLGRVYFEKIHLE